MNLVTSRPARKAALVAPMRSGRALVMLPWQGRTLIGTSESADERQPDDQDARRDEVNAFVREINETFSAFELEPGEVSLVHRGVVPAGVNDRRLSLLGHSRIIDHGEEGTAQQLISVVGVKYTTARLVAEHTVDRVQQKLGRPPVKCRTAETVLPGAALENRDPPEPVMSRDSRGDGVHPRRRRCAKDRAWRCRSSRRSGSRKRRGPDADGTRLVRGAEAA